MALQMASTQSRLVVSPVAPSVCSRWDPRGSSSGMAVHLIHYQSRHLGLKSAWGLHFASWWAFLSENPLLLSASTHLHVLSHYTHIYIQHATRYMPHTCYPSTWETHPLASSHGAFGASASLGGAISYIEDVGRKALAIANKGSSHNQQRFSYPESPTRAEYSNCLDQGPCATLPLICPGRVELVLFQ